MADEPGAPRKAGIGSASLAWAGSMKPTSSNIQKFILPERRHGAKAALAFPSLARRRSATGPRISSHPNEAGLQVLAQEFRDLVRERPRRRAPPPERAVAEGE